MNKFLKKHCSLIILTVLSLITRFFYFSRPSEIVFDETYFGKFVLHYFSGTNYFDIHPPFGKLIFFFFVKIFGLDFITDQPLETILADPKNLFILRLVPAIFGVLLIPLIYKFVEVLSKSKKAAFLAGFFILIDNAFLTYSRFIFLDIILIFFGIFSLWFLFIGLQRIKIYHLYHDRNKDGISIYSFLYYLVLSAISLGATISIKWTGLAIAGIIIATLFWKLFRKQISFRKWAVALTIYIIIPVLFYIAVFAGHFALIKKIGDDSAFFTQKYLKTLKGNSVEQNVKPLNFWSKFFESNKTMFSSNSGLSATHPYSSQFWQWPLSQKPVYLWQSKTNGSNTANIWLLGNLVIWLAGFLAVLIVSLGEIKNLIIRRKKRRDPSSFACGDLLRMTGYKWLLFAYLANLLPFIFIKRVLFLYHYFFSVIFAIILLSILLAKLLELYPKTKKIVYIFIAGAIIFFILFSPLSYGFFEPVKSYNFQLKFIW